MLLNCRRWCRHLSSSLHLWSGDNMWVLGFCQKGWEETGEQLNEIPDVLTASQVENRWKLITALFPPTPSLYYLHPLIRYETPLPQTPNICSPVLLQVCLIWNHYTVHLSYTFPHTARHEWQWVVFTRHFAVVINQLMDFPAIKHRKVYFQNCPWAEGIVKEPNKCTMGKRKLDSNAISR